MIQDISAAIRKLLLQDPTVDGAVNGRVYVEELPESEHKEMPRACVVLKEAGGLPIMSWEPYLNPRYDVFCFGKDYYEAGEVDRAVTEVLHNMDRKVVNKTLLHTAVIQGARFFKTGDTGWPVKHRSLSLIGSTTEA
jgi:hypothetical protein